MDQAIANRFYEYRKKSGLSQEELAAKLGISRQSVSKWERGEASPDTANLIRLAKLYGVSLDDLVNGITLEETAAPAQPECESVPQPEEKFPQDVPSDSAAGQAGGDEKPNVHISWKDGIHVEDEDATVHISWKDGIHVEDGKDTVHVGRGGVTVTDRADSVEKNKDKAKKHAKKKHFEFPTDTIVTVAFLYLGFAHGLWHPAWMLFFLIPLVHGLGDAIRKRKFVIFPFPVLAAAVFLCLGFCWGLWHPGWLAFLLIPIYYPVASWLDREISGEEYE